MTVVSPPHSAAARGEQGPGAAALAVTAATGTWDLVWAESCQGMGLTHRGKDKLQLGTLGHREPGSLYGSPKTPFSCSYQADLSQIQHKM